jgi:hypothetical protein
MATLMSAMTLVSVGLAVLIVMPAWIGVFVAAVISVSWIAFLAAGAVFGKWAGQTFCIGALAAHWLSRVDLMYFAVPSSFQDPSGLYAVVNVMGIIVVDSFAGWVCIRARRFWEERAQ